MAGRKSLNRPQVVAGRVASRPGRQRPLVLGTSAVPAFQNSTIARGCACRRSAPKLDAAIADVGNLAKSIDAAKVGRTVDNVDRFAQTLGARSRRFAVARNRVPFSSRPQGAVMVRHVARERCSARSPSGASVSSQNRPGPRASA